MTYALMETCFGGAWDPVLILNTNPKKNWNKSEPEDLDAKMLHELSHIEDTRDIDEPDAEKVSPYHMTTAQSLEDLMKLDLNDYRAYFQPRNRLLRKEFLQLKKVASEMRDNFFNSLPGLTK